MSLIFYLSHLPGKSLSLPNVIHIDKALHCMVYAILGITYLIALSPQCWRHPRLFAASAVMFCLFYGITDEFHQSFVPGRSVSGADVAADVAGGLLAAILFLGWHWYRTRATLR
ncbi:MAG: VanZ family protein [Desulfobulbus sp.]